MAKPTKLPEWDTTQVNAIEPTTERKEQGWLAPGGVPEKPPFQTFNYWQNEVYRWLKAVNDQGVLEYDNLTDYTANLSYVVGSDGSLYRCLTDNGPSSSVVDPVGDLTGTWSKQPVGIASVAEVQAGADNEKAVTPFGLAGFAKSLTTNGYINLPGGLVLQWGTIAGVPFNATNQSFAFPITFPNATLNITASGYGSGGTTDFFSVNILSFSSSGVTNYQASTNLISGSFNFRWVAIGY